MSQDAQPVPLEAGTHVPGALDHAWVVEGMDQQWGLALGADPLTTWTARVRCVHCHQRVDFRAEGVPPCRPQEAPP